MRAMLSSREEGRGRVGRTLAIAAVLAATVVILGEWVGRGRRWADSRSFRLRGGGGADGCEGEEEPWLAPLPWQEDPLGWAAARADNAVVEERHRQRDAIVYFLHISKGGGSSVCMMAARAGEFVTQKSLRGTEINLDRPGELRNGNCNIFWAADQGPELDPGPGRARTVNWKKVPDPRLRGTAAEQRAVAADLNAFCEEDLQRCGISMAGNERELPPPGSFLTGPRRPWVYVAVVREPLDLVLSNWMMLHPGAPVTAEALTTHAWKSKRGGHLASLFAGVQPSGASDASLVGSQVMRARYVEAVDRLKHFSVIVDTTTDFKGGAAVLAARLGWPPLSDAEDPPRVGTHNGACMRCQPAYTQSRVLRDTLEALFAVDMHFYGVTAALAKRMIAEM